MYARLNHYYWVVDGSGVRSAFILTNISRYAGMLQGATLDGRPVARPLADFEALSLDGADWKPLKELQHLIPWENGSCATT